MQKIVWRTLAVGTALVFVLSVAPVVAFADDGDSANGSSSGSSRNSESENETEDATDDKDGLRQRIQELKQERQANKQQKLEANKLKACENRKTKITAIMARSVTRAEKQIDVFTKIADRVKTFYTEKGRTVANYDDLVSAVDAAKAKAEANLETLKGLEPFDCNSDDPKGDIEAFKLAIKSINQDLKDYRTSIKNLIVAVKSAQSTTAQEQQNQGQEQEQQGGEQ